MTKDADLILNSWRDLLKNPTQWRDHREIKLNGSMTIFLPVAFVDVRLFVNCVPRVTTLMPLCLNSYDDSWKELVENPEKWWDNRSNKEVLSISFDDSNKINKKSPDFKHKDSGKVLWLKRLTSVGTFQVASSESLTNFISVVY